MAGRPKGTKDSKPRVTAARALAEAARATGITPLEVLLTTMRAAWDAGQAEADDAAAIKHRMVACDIAERAAPFCHARLAATTLTHKDALSNITEEQLDALLTLAERNVGAGLAIGFASGEAASPIGKPH